MTTPVRRRSHRFAPLLVAALCAVPGSLRAQATTRVVPAAAAPADGSRVEPFLLNGFEGRTQVLIDRAQLGQLATKSIRRIVLRRDAQTNDRLPAGMRGGWIDLVVLASWTPRSPRNPDARFARNHDPKKGPVIVYRGPYHVLDSPPLPKGTKVASFAPNVSAHILLQAPIRPASAGNLCLEFVHRRHATRAGPGIWLADLADVSASSRRFFGRSCWRQGQQDPTAARLLPGATVGGSLTCTTLGPVTPLALLVLGASDTSWGPLRLPLDLGPFGAKGCLLYVSQDLRLPSALRPTPRFPAASSVEEVPVPLAAQLVGARIYSQWVFFDPAANALALTMTNGVSIALAAAPPNLGAAMVQALDPAAPLGRVQLHRAPVLQLSDR